MACHSPTNFTCNSKACFHSAYLLGGEIREMFGSNCPCFLFFPPVPGIMKVEHIYNNRLLTYHHFHVT